VALVGFVHPRRDVAPLVSTHERRLEITEQLVRAYSRRGNYHSEAATSDALGLPGLVAQGVQVAGPAYGELLDAWGEDFLARGLIDMKFVGVVLAGTTVQARVDIDDGHADFEVSDASAGRAVVVGTAELPPKQL
jgi:acyl dehydratase